MTTGKYNWYLFTGILAFIAFITALAILFAWRGLPIPIRIHYRVNSLRNSDWRVRENAANDLVTIGEPAIPMLLRSMRSDDKQVRSEASGVLAKIGPASTAGLIKLLKDPNPNVRADAADTLSGFTAQANAVVPALCSLLTDVDSKVRQRAAVSLGYMGPVAHPAIRQLIDVMRTDVDPNIRRWATVSLGWIGPAAKVMPDLLAALDDESSLVRVTVVQVLSGGHVAPWDVQARRDGFRIEAIPGLLIALRHKDPAVREAAGMGLQRFGPEAKEIVPVLLEAVDVADQRSKTYIIDALRHIDPETGDRIKRN